MKTIKQITAAILVISVIIFLSTCKKIIFQTDKPLDDVLAAHVWNETSYISVKKKIKSNLYYHFFQDSICLENFDIEDDSLNYPDYFESSNSTTQLSINFKERWWLEYRNNNPVLFIKKITFDSIDGSTNISYSEYRVKKYDEYKIKTYLILPKPEGYPIDDSVKVIFKAVN